MNEQYYHDNSRKAKTVYLEVPSQNDLFDLLQIHSAHKINMKIGIAKLHPSDQYVKKIGREISKQKATRIEFKLLNAAYLKESVEILLSSGKIDLVLKLNPNNKKAHFIHATTL